MQWFVVGISGATCSGKSTLAKMIRDNFPKSVIVSQDDYFLPADDPRHIMIQELNHLNWDLITSLDMQRMHSDIIKILESHENGILKKKEQCWERRKNRKYDPPDVPGYFEKVVWPEYIKYKNEIMEKSELRETITFIDGSKDIRQIYNMVSQEIKQLLS